MWCCLLLVCGVLFLLFDGCVLMDAFCLMVGGVLVMCVVCCRLFVCWCVLFDVCCCRLFVVLCCVLLVVVRCSLRLVCCVLSVVWCLRMVVFFL